MYPSIPPLSSEEGSSKTGINMLSYNNFYKNLKAFEKADGYLDLQKLYSNFYQERKYVRKIDGISQRFFCKHSKTQTIPKQRQNSTESPQSFKFNKRRSKSVKIPFQNSKASLTVSTPSYEFRPLKKTYLLKPRYGLPENRRLVGMSQSLDLHSKRFTSFTNYVQTRAIENERAIKEDTKPTDCLKRQTTNHTGPNSILRQKRQLRSCQKDKPSQRDRERSIRTAGGLPFKIKVRIKTARPMLSKDFETAKISHFRVGRPSTGNDLVKERTLSIARNDCNKKKQRVGTHLWVDDCESSDKSKHKSFFNQKRENSPTLTRDQKNQLLINSWKEKLINSFESPPSKQFYLADLPPEEIIPSLPLNPNVGLKIRDLGSLLTAPGLVSCFKPCPWPRALSPGERMAQRLGPTSRREPSRHNRKRHREDCRERWAQQSMLAIRYYTQQRGASAIQ